MIPTMQCPQCGIENPAGAKFCRGCGVRLDAICRACRHSNLPGSRFCNECGHPLAADTPTPPTTGATFTATPPSGAASIAQPTPPGGYTPKHLADKILKARSALEGERRQVTVLFADMVGFTSLAEKLDPEEVHRVINDCFELITAEVHRFE